MRETIARMLKVEAEAKQILADAEEEAAKIVRDARKEAVAIEQQAEREAQARAAETVKHAIEDARQRRTDILAEIDARIDGLRRLDPEKARAARELIRAELTGP
ncbi:MAG: hypothetical protein R6V58_00265 [Planctomycetota bacterium]